MEKKQALNSLHCPVAADQCAAKPSSQLTCLASALADEGEVAATVGYSWGVIQNGFKIDFNFFFRESRLVEISVKARGGVGGRGQTEKTGKQTIIEFARQRHVDHGRDWIISCFPVVTSLPGFGVRGMNLSSFIGLLSKVGQNTKTEMKRMGSIAYGVRVRRAKKHCAHCVRAFLTYIVGD